MLNKSPSVLLPPLILGLGMTANGETLDQILTGADCQIFRASYLYSIDQVGEFADLASPGSNQLECSVETDSMFGVAARVGTISKAVALMERGNVMICYSDRWTDSVECGFPVFGGTTMADRVAFPPSASGWQSDDQVLVVVEYTGPGGKLRSVLIYTN